MRHQKRLLTAATIMIGLLLLAACGAQPGDYSNRQFQSVAELAKTVEEVAGWECVYSDRDNESHTSDSLAKYGAAAAPCSNGAVTIFASDKVRADQDAEPYNALKPGYCQIVGGNWRVWGQQYIVQAAQKAMQGKLTCA